MPVQNLLDGHYFMFVDTAIQDEGNVNPDRYKYGWRLMDTNFPMMTITVHNDFIEKLDKIISPC